MAHVDESERFTERGVLPNQVVELLSEMASRPQTQSAPCPSKRATRSSSSAVSSGRTRRGHAPGTGRGHLRPRGRRTLRRSPPGLGRGGGASAAREPRLCLDAQGTLLRGGEHAPSTSPEKTAPTR